MRAIEPALPAGPAGPQGPQGPAGAGGSQTPAVIPFFATPVFDASLDNALEITAGGVSL